MRIELSSLRRLIGGLAGFLLVIDALSIAPAWGQEGPPVVVVVNSENDVTELSVDDVRHIFLGERKYWPSGDPIEIVMPRPGTLEMEHLMKFVFETTSTIEVARHFMFAVYQHKIARPPPTLSTADAIAKVEASKTAIAVISREQSKGRTGLKIVGTPGP